MNLKILNLAKKVKRIAVLDNNAIFCNNLYLSLISVKHILQVSFKSLPILNLHVEIFEKKVSLN